jgi:DNA polymerase-3 subunit alpha
MQAAQVLAGFSLGKADLLRRAMGKKKAEEMAQQREIFVKGCHEKNNIPKTKANQIFDLLEKFAGYGFNKSHAAAYAIVAYQTAYLKANYPVEFFCAMMTNDMSDTAKLRHYIARPRHGR